MSPARTRIVAVMPHGPAYDYRPGEEPEVSWRRPDGGVVGFWPREWMDHLGAEILKRTPRYSWEVWQPDFRADKVYSRDLPTGVTHRLFPAAEKIYGSWPLARAGLASPAMLEALKGLGGQRALVMLYGTYGFRIPFFMEILRALKEEKRLPVFLRSGGMFRAPLSDFFGLHRPRTYLELLAEHAEMKDLFARADAVSEQSAAALAEVRKVYGGPVEKLTMGCDFSFWTPPPPGARAAARAELGIREGMKVFFASGNFVPRKQLDRLAGVFAGLGRRGDFFLLIAGQGDRRNTEKLSSLLSPLAASGQARLHPYAEGEALRKLYWASDVYASVATDEGGPASVMKAMACGLPVLSTPVGATADKLKAAGAGALVPVRGYAEWGRAIAAMLDGALPPSLPADEARAEYDWDAAAARFIAVYDNLTEKYFGRDDGS